MLLKHSSIMPSGNQNFSRDDLFSQVCRVSSTSQLARSFTDERRQTPPAVGQLKTDDAQLDPQRQSGIDRLASKHDVSRFAVVCCKESVQSSCKPAIAEGEDRPRRAARAFVSVCDGHANLASQGAVHVGRGARIGVRGGGAAGIPYCPCVHMNCARSTFHAVCFGVT